MEPTVISLGYRGEAIRARLPVDRRRESRIEFVRLLALFAIAGSHPALARGQIVPSPAGPPATVSSPKPLMAAGPNIKPKPGTATASAIAPGTVAPAVVNEPASVSRLDINPATANRFKVRDAFDNCVVARLHGQCGEKTALILPDGQLGFPNRLVPTNEPFRPLTADQLEILLQEKSYPDYQVLKTEHYLVFFKSTRAFAQDSARLLEDLYKGLIEAFLRNGFPVHATEFPLVAVVFATERDFRDHKHVDPQVQAYYEFFTNRIFFYQKSERDALEPRLATLLKPQTVAHEGAHQILSNIGLQPRPCAWPQWLVEGLAEYCATTVTTKKGIVWRGMAAINALHMATLRELYDPLPGELDDGEVPHNQLSRKHAMEHTESLVLKTALGPADYAQAWALTHYLAQKRGDDFVKYLKAMSQLPPLKESTPQEDLAEFRRFFGVDSSKLDKKLDEHIRKLSQKKGYDPLPFYTVIFAQSMDNGVIRRLAKVSQSPQVIEGWVQEQTLAGGGEPNWETYKWPTRARAVRAAEEWMRRGF